MEDEGIVLAATYTGLIGATLNMVPHNLIRQIGFISGSGDKRGHGKTPLFMAGMKCLPLCKVPLLSAANNYVESQNEPRVKK